jgi:hypothetical protein
MARQFLPAAAILAVSVSFLHGVTPMAIRLAPLDLLAVTQPLQVVKLAHARRQAENMPSRQAPEIEELSGVRYAWRGLISRPLFGAPSCSNDVVMPAPGFCTGGFHDA